MKSGRIGVGLLALALVSTAATTRANDDLLRALGLGLGVVNNIQQQQQQQQRQQRPQQQRQATPQRQAAPAQSKAVDTAAAQRQRAAVAEVQEALNRLGYDAGPVDGDPGPRTRNAIAAFRADYGLDPGTGIDDQLAGAIRVAARSAPAGAIRASRVAGAPVAVSPPLWDEPEPQRSASTASMQNGTLMIDGRVAAATNNDFQGLTADFGEVDIAANLRRVVFDYTLSLTPDLLDDDEAALSTIALLQPDFAGDILEQAFARPLDKNEANAVRRGLVERDVIGRLGPFEKKAVLEAVRANADRIVRTDLPPLPIPLRVFCRVRLLPYDFETLSFPTSDRACNNRVQGADGAELVGPEMLPERAPMAPDAAEAFQSGRTGQTYLAAFDAELDIEPGALGARSAPRLTVSARTGLRLLAPGSLTEVIYDFGRTEAPDSGVPTMQDGVLLIDGRMAALSTTNMSVYGLDLDSGALEAGMRDLVFAYGLKLRPDALAGDQEAFSALAMLPLATMVEVVEAAVRRPLTEAELGALKSGGPLYVTMNEFERRRALDDVRARAAGLVRPDLPAPPLRLRIFCEIDLEDYDFETQSFPVGRQDCDEGVAGAGEIRLAGAGPVPERIEMPSDRAEAFAAAVGGGRAKVLASFDADLDLVVRRSEAGSELLVTRSAGSGLRLHPPGSFTEVLYRAPEPGAAPVAAAPRPTPERVWNLKDARDRVELAALAGEPITFPADGAAFLAATGTLGSVVGDVAIRRDEAGGYSPSPLFNTYHVAERAALAAALALPVDYVVELWGPPGGRGLGGVYGLLPAPAGRFAATPPSDRYGETDIGYQWTAAVAGVHDFALPGGGNVLVAVLQPVEGRFTTRDYENPQVLERFDLAAVREAPPEVEVIEPESRAAVALAAAGGGEPVEFLTELLDSRMTVFERKDLAEELLAAEGGREPRLASFWAEGELTLGEYDLKAEAFPVTAAGFAPVELLRSNDLPPHAVRVHLAAKGLAIAMDPERARAWTETYGDNRHRVRARFSIVKPDIGNGSVTVHGKLLEAEILSPDAVITRRDPEAVLWRFEAAPQPAAAAAPSPGPKAEPAPKPAPAPVTRDILGIALGTPLDRAVATVATEVGPTAQYGLTRDQIPDRVGTPDVKAWGSFATATLFHNDASRVSIALFSEPPAAADQVTAILRSQSFVDAGRPHPDAIETILFDKYGAADEATALDFGRSLVWFGAAATRDRCFSEQKSAARNAAIDLHNLQRSRKPSGESYKPSIWRDASGVAWTGAESGTIDLRMTFVRLSECAVVGEVLVALIMTDPDGLVSSLQLALANPAQAGRWAQLNEEAAEESAPTSASGLEVKL